MSDGHYQQTRYRRAASAIQAAVKFLMGYRNKETEPASLRVGVNMAMVENTALGRLLIKKGTITEDEYLTALADEAEREVERYQERIREQEPGFDIELHPGRISMKRRRLGD